MFLAVGERITSFWVLHEGKEFNFVLKQVNEKQLQREFFKELYSKITDPKEVRCEDRSLDEPMVEELRGQENDHEEKRQSSKEDDLKRLYDMVISPIADFIDGTEITIVPDGPLFLAPFAAFMDQNSKYLSETFTIRLIPTLTSLKMMAECPEGYHSTTGALLVGDPYVKNIRIEIMGRKKQLPQLPAALKEVEVIGKILRTKPLTGESATKAEVLRRLCSVALVHISAHGSAN